MNATIRNMNQGEEREVCKLIEGVFEEFVGCDYSPEGVAEFMKYCRADAMAARKDNHFVLVAKACGAIVGAIEIRNNEHICLFFVRRDHHGKGVGRKLFDAAVEMIRAQPDAPGGMTVNSSPFAVRIYEKLGFVQTGPEQTINGITFVPMARE